MQTASPLQQETQLIPGATFDISTLMDVKLTDMLAYPSGDMLLARGVALGVQQAACQVSCISLREIPAVDLGLRQGHTVGQEHAAPLLYTAAHRTSFLQHKTCPTTAR